MLIGAVLFVPLALWVAGAFGAPPRPGREWAGWLGAVAFVLVAIMLVLRLRDASDQIVVDEAGLTWRSWSDEHIPWEAVLAIEERAIRRQVMFAVHLHDARAHPPSRLIGKIAAAQSGMGMGHFNLLASGTDRSADELRDALIRFRPGG
jgi:hypothetical protein